jgi:ABC-2 type transport system ATP-binding protein
MTKVPDGTHFGVSTLRVMSIDHQAISVRALTKFYGSKLGVEDISFDVQPGQVMGFLGPNGSGKTTVMRLLVGLLRISRGEARILGENVTDPKGHVRRHIGYLPGTLALYENMTVSHYLRLLADLRNSDCITEALSMCDRLQLSATSPIKGLSKGNKQKIGVVQAFMHSPPVLILDEPTAGLDPIVQREFEEIVRERSQSGAAILLSSHVLSEVEQLASDVVILDHGRLVVQDRIEVLKARIERRIRFDFPFVPAAETFAGCPGVVHVEHDDRSITCTVVGSEGPVLERAAHVGVESVRTFEPSLDEIFLTATSGSAHD